LRAHLGWLMSEWRRNDPWHMAEAGRAIAHFDARPWASSLSVPVCVVLTSKDQLVAPAKQRTLADATDATVLPLDGDHFVNVMKPTEFSATTARAVQEVLNAPATAPIAH
jgi:hypothetical protein